MRQRGLSRPLSPSQRHWRHTSAALGLTSGEATKVVTERLGDSTTTYMQDAYQEVMPGMQHEAARRFNQRLREPDDHGASREDETRG